MAAHTKPDSKRHGPLQRVIHCSLALVASMALLACFGGISVAQERADTSKELQEIRTLELGKPIERELKGGEVHTYQITLAAGQYLHVIVDQRGIDVVVKLFGPERKQIIEVDSPNGKKGPESIKQIAVALGIYRLEVHSPQKDVATGHYEVRIQELREAISQDKSRIAAENAFAEGARLRKQGTAEFRQRAVERFKDALQLWYALGDSAEMAKMLTNIGEVYYMLGENQKALDHLMQALPLKRAIGTNLEEAETLNSIAVIHLNMGNVKKALEYLNNALPLMQATGDSSGEADILNTLGGAYDSIDEKQKALDYYGRALTLRRAVGNRRGEANTLINIGTVYSDLGKKQEAFDHYDRALSLYRAIGDRRGEATTLNNIGLAHDDLGEKKKALEYYAQALPIYRAAGDRQREAITLNNIGLAYHDLGELQKALTYYEQALPLRRATGNRRGEASTLHNIAGVYDGLGERQKAFDYYNQALSLRRVVGDRRGEAATLNNIGSFYDDLGEKQKALDYFGQALALYRAAEDRQGEAATLTNIGSVYRALGEYQKALDNCEQALQLKRAVGDRYGEAHVLDDIALIYSSSGESPKALDYFLQALPLRRTVGDRRGEAATLTNIGYIYNALGDTRKAVEYYEQALPLRRAVGDPSGEANTLFGLARAEQDGDNLNAARNHIEAALAIVELLRTKVASQDLRTSYFASVQKMYEFYIALLMRFHELYPFEGYEAAALQASERGRARSILETLTEARIDIRQGVDSSLVARERLLQQQLNAKEQYRIKLLSGKSTAEQTVSVEKETASLLTQYQEVQVQIRANSPSYAALTQPQPLTLPEIQQQVLDDETLLLEYASGEQRSFLWAVTRTTINSFVLPKRAEIDSLARHVYDLLTARNQRLANETSKQRLARITQTDSESQKAAATLSQILLAPIAAQLETKRLLVVTEGALQYIPFGALPAPQITGYRPLVVDHEIVSLPSASVLAVLRRELAEQKQPTKMVAVLADPVFSDTDPRVKQGQNGARKNSSAQKKQSHSGSIRDGEMERALEEVRITDGGLTIPRLAFSRREAEGIFAFARAQESMKALDFAASRATATSAELRQYRIVHFATHGLLNSMHPELSGVVLSLVDEKGVSQDGFLRLHEIYNLNLPVDLVVLSACQTALGKEVKGEGLIGLTRGFMYAGAPRVVASLWKVDDEATAELMKHFYRKMLGKEKLRAAAALRAAQVDMLKEKRWQSPYYWAAFVLQGEWR